MKRVGLLAGLLVLVLGSGVVAQEPSPPPWFGGRVEMPEHGFGVTLPDDWVAFDTAADAVSQLEAASGFVDPDVWAAEDAELVAVLSSMSSTGTQLFAGHTASVENCAMGVIPMADGKLDAVADLLFESTVEDPTARDVEPPQYIDLPAGPAYLIRMSGLIDFDSELWAPQSQYLLDMDGGVLTVFCSTDDARPDDDWLSVVETIEFLPAEE